MKQIKEQKAEFETPGAFVEGQLVEVDSVNIGAKTVARYLLLDQEKGALWCVLGTESLKRLIFKPMIGKFLRITLTGYNEKFGTKENPMREFAVEMA